MTSSNNQSQTQVRSEQDAAWKDILDAYFKEFIEFFYPIIAQKIAWSAGYESLDKELLAITTDAMIGKTFVDKLVKVKSLDGKESVVLIHVEVQGQKEDEFPKRLFQYYCKLFSKYDQSILTLAILTDSNKTWQPKNYASEVLGFPVINFNFWTHKLLDYRDKKQALETSDNPFAMVVLVQLIFLETKRNPKTRFLMKLQLTRRLYDRGYGRDYVINLLKVLDWALVIPENLELEYKQKLYEFEEDRKMAYVTSFERLSREEGLKQGREEGREEERSKTLDNIRNLLNQLSINLLNQNVPLPIIKSAIELSKQEIALEDA